MPTSGRSSTGSHETICCGFSSTEIGDKRVLRLIAKWLNAGVMEGTEWKDDLQGTPQGAVVSPILANVSSVSGFRAGCQFFDLYNFSSCGITVV